MPKHAREHNSATAGRRTSKRATPPPARSNVSAVSRPTATSYDVAQIAGVSQSAVSRCFRAGASISEETRARVMKAARQLGYAPDAIARSLTTRRSNLVAVIISNLTNLHYPEVLSELNQRLSERNVHLLLFTIQSESEVDRILDQVWQYRVDGVIAAARLSEQQVREFEHRGVPLVFYNRYLRERPVNAVCCDQLESARSIISGLLAAGHRTFGIVGGPPDSVVAEARVHGCLDHLKRHRIRDIVTVRGDFTYEGGRRALGEITGQLGKTPQAVICATDIMALGCIDGARFDLHLAVPDELSVVGFDGVEPGGWASYRLATIRQPVQRMAEAAVTLLLECVADPARPPEKRVFVGTLVEGKSARLRKSAETAKRAPSVRR